MESAKPRILIACVPEAANRIFAILPGVYQTFVTTMRDAKAALASASFDLIMIGVYFDNSQMFELLSYVRNHETYRNVPVICFRGVSLPQSKHSSNAEVAWKAAGASMFVDLTQYPDDGIGNRETRRLITEAMRRTLPTGRSLPKELNT